jgi:hypothetical protein
MDEEQAPITWNHELEQLLAEEGEKALGSSWLHGQCEAYYAKRNQWITIPCVVLSTLSGAGSIGSQTMFSDGKTASLAIGALSIFIGILQTLGSFWSFAKQQEAHRNADIQWSKLHRFIAVEMTLPRNERIAARDMLKICREGIERLCETSPLIPDEILHKFQNKFSKTYANVAIPDVANGLKKIVINSPPVGETPSFHLNKNIGHRVDGNNRDSSSSSYISTTAHTTSKQNEGQAVIKDEVQGQAASAAVVSVVGTE